VSRVLEWGLRAWAVLLVVAAVLWVLGPYGAGPVGGRHLMRWPFWPFLQDGPLEGLLTGPVFAADLAEESARTAVFQLGQRLTDYDGKSVEGSFGEINLGWSVQFISMTWWQQMTFVALHVAPLLVMAVLWWSLASVVRQSRSESVFTEANARRLTSPDLSSRWGLRCCRWRRGGSTAGWSRRHNWRAASKYRVSRSSRCPGRQLLPAWHS